MAYIKFNKKTTNQLKDLLSKVNTSLNAEMSQKQINTLKNEIDRREEKSEELQSDSYIIQDYFNRKRWNYDDSILNYKIDEYPVVYEIQTSEIKQFIKKYKIKTEKDLRKLEERLSEEHTKINFPLGVSIYNYM